MSATVARKKVNMRVAESTLATIDEAASIQGVDRTSFVIDAAATKARRVILEEQVLTLSQREVEQVKELLDAEAKPVEALTKAAERLRSLGL